MCQCNRGRQWSENCAIYKMGVLQKKNKRTTALVERPPKTLTLQKVQILFIMNPTNPLPLHTCEEDRVFLQWVFISSIYLAGEVRPVGGHQHGTIGFASEVDWPEQEPGRQRGESGWAFREKELGVSEGVRSRGGGVRLRWAVCVGREGGFSASASLAKPATMAWFMSIWFSLGLGLPTPVEQDPSCPDFQFTAAQQPWLPKLFSTDLFYKRQQICQMKRRAGTLIKMKMELRFRRD